MVPLHSLQRPPPPQLPSLPWVEDLPGPCPLACEPGTRPLWHLPFLTSRQFSPADTDTRRPPPSSDRPRGDPPQGPPTAQFQITCADNPNSRPNSSAGRQWGPNPAASPHQATHFPCLFHASNHLTSQLPSCVLCSTMFDPSHPAIPPLPTCPVDIRCLWLADATYRRRSH